MADTRTFVLIGKFDDQITPKLKLINKEIAKLSDLFKNTNKNFSQFNTGAMDFSKSLSKVTSAAKDAKRALDDLGNVKSSMKGAAGAADSFSKSMQDVGRSSGAIKQMTEGMDSFGHSAKKAHEETRGLLQTILKAEAFSKIGEGFAEGLQEGAHKTVEILHKGVEFMSERFKEAIEDEGHEVAAQMQYYSQIKAKNLLPDTSKLTGVAKALQDIKNVNIGREQYEIGEANVQQFAKGKAVSQDSLTSVYRALSPYMVPDFLQRMGVNKNARADELAKALSTKKDPLTGKTFTDTMGPGMTALTTLAQTEGGGSSGGTKNVIRELQEYVESGLMKPQAMAWMNPLFKAQTKALTAKYEGQGMEATAARGRAMTEASITTVPMESLNIASQTVQAGIENLKQSILSPKTGIVSLNAPALRAIDPKTGKPYGYGFGVKAATGGAQLDENYNPILSTVKQGSAYAIHYAEITKSYGALIEGAKGNAAMLKIYKDEQAVSIAKLNQFYVAIHSPMDMITAELGPLLSKLAKLFSSANNVFIEPIMAMMDHLGSSLAQLGVTIDILSDDVKRGKRDLAGALGNLMANILKTITTMFGPDEVDKAQGAVGKAIKSFLDSFNKAGGAKFMKQIMDGLKSMVMKILFNNGNVLNGTTPIANFLITLFAALSAPSVILAIVSGITPLITESLVHMVGSVFEKATAKAVVSEVAETAAAPAMSQAQRYLNTGGFTKKPKLGSVEQGLTAPSETGEGIGALGKLGIAAAVTTVAIYALGGSAENTNRQLASVGKNISTSFSGILDTIGRTVGELTGHVDLASNKFGGLAHQVDLVRALLFPLTATFQLLDVGAAALVLAFQKTGAGLGHAYAFIERLIGHGRQADLADKKASDLDQTAKATEKSIREKMARNEVYNTSIRFGGEENYAKKIKQDIVSKYKKSQSQPLGSKERASSLADLNYLKNQYKYAMEAIGKQGDIDPKKLVSPSTVVKSPSPKGLVPQKQEETTKAVSAGASLTSKHILDSAAMTKLTTILEADKTINVTKTGTDRTITATKAGTDRTITATKAGAEKTATASVHAGQLMGSKIDNNSKVNSTGFRGMIAAIGNMGAQIQSAIASVSGGGVGGGGGLDLGGLSGGGQGGSGDFKKWDKNLMAATAAVDKKYGVPLGTTASIFMFESSGSTSVTNSIGATGLFQVMPGTAPELGTSTAAIRKMGGVQQTALFDKYLSQRGYKPGMGPTRMYSTVLAGNPYAVNSRDANSTSAAGAYPTQARYAAQARAAMGNLNQANALGPNMPMFFGSKSAARDWESKMAPSGAKVKTFTTNTAEMGGGPNINNSITIHQQPNQDPDHLASLVVQKMGEWVSEARSSTIFV